MAGWALENRYFNPKFLFFHTASDFPTVFCTTETFQSTGTGFWQIPKWDPILCLSSYSLFFSHAAQQPYTERGVVCFPTLDCRLALWLALTRKTRWKRQWALPMGKPRGLSTHLPSLWNSACWRMKDHMEESPDVPGKAILGQPTASKPQSIKRAQPRSTA